MPERLRALADRHTGVGFDQALMLEAPRAPDTACSIGSSTPTAARSSSAATVRAASPRCCIAAAATRPASSMMDSPAGPVRARVGRRRLVSVDMGVPNFDPASLPFEARPRPTLCPRGRRRGASRSARSRMGNPHAVLQRRERRDARRSRGSGPASSAIRAFRSAPTWASCKSWIARHIRLRVFERGAGETLGLRHGRLRRRGGRPASAACSTPRCGCDLPRRRVARRLGGSGRAIWLTGPAQIVF